MGAPLFSYKVSRSILGVLNSGVTGFCFHSKLRKSSKDLFFLVATKENWRPSPAKICGAASLKTLREDPSVRALQKQAVWKLLSEISVLCSYFKQSSSKFVSSIAKVASSYQSCIYPAKWTECSLYVHTFVNVHIKLIINYIFGHDQWCII